MSNLQYPPESQEDWEALAWRRVLCVVSNGNGQWLFCRRGDDAWLFPEGERCPGERPEICAERILMEQTGIRTSNWQTVAIYSVRTDCVPESRKSKKNGKEETIPETKEYGVLLMGQVVRDPLGFSDVTAEVKYFQSVPVVAGECSQLRRDQIAWHRECFQWVQGYCNCHSSAKDDEEWDILDARRRPMGYTKKRREQLLAGEYHLVVQVWIGDRHGNFLITKRAPCKGYPLFWETTGGSAVSGDDSSQAAIREVAEETGLILRPEDGQWIRTDRIGNDFCDVWVFLCRNLRTNAVRLEPGETVDACLATPQEILTQMAKGQFVPCHNTDFSFFEECGRILQTIANRPEIPKRS